MKILKSKYFKFIVVSILIISIVLALPSTMAKYTQENTYEISVNYNDKGSYYSTSGQGTFTADASGYYAIIAKGGDGALGHLGSKDRDKKAATGGIGGTVSGAFYLNKNDTITINVGSAGECPSSCSTRGMGGTNGSGACSGGNGDNNAVFATSPTKSTGGGAATIVRASSGSLILIAGGGGAGGSVDSNYLVGALTAGANGGAGGSLNSSHSNFNSLGIVFNGSNAATNNKARYGKGGTTAGGGVTASTLSDITGKSGSVIEVSGTSVSNGNGGNGGGFGGGGGAGFAGGGGGSGNGLNGFAPGGGGGGSSFLVGSSGGKSSMVLNTTAYNYVTGLTYSGSSVSTTQTGGYVVIKYLGNSVNNFSSGEIMSAYA